MIDYIKKSKDSQSFYDWRGKLGRALKRLLHRKARARSKRELRKELHGDSHTK